jgi:hypothetical protein
MPLGPTRSTHLEPRFEHKRTYPAGDLDCLDCHSDADHCADKIPNDGANGQPSAVTDSHPICPGWRDMGA